MSTGYGFTGPMTERGATFDAKAEGGAGRVSLLPLTGAGGWLLWVSGSLFSLGVVIAAVIVVRLSIR